MSDRPVDPRLRERFNDGALERLARAEPEYCATHGHYVPELAALLLAERRAAEARVVLLEALREAAEVRSKVPHDWHDETRHEPDDREWHRQTICEIVDALAALSAGPGADA